MCCISFFMLFIMCHNVHVAEWFEHVARTIGKALQSPTSAVPKLYFWKLAESVVT